MSENINIIDDLIAEGRRMAENETEADILAEMQESGEVARFYADRLDAAHKREIDVLKQRCAELNAEVAAKNEVIRRLNDAVSKEQRRRWQLLKNSSAVGDCAKLREALSKSCAYSAVVLNTGMFNRVHLEALLNMAKAAIAAPSRNCDLPKVVEDPWRAWLDDKSNWDEFGSPKLEIHDWLLYPVTEKEGGNDGNE